MIPARYPAPAAAKAFSDVHRFELWKEITDLYALAYAETTHGADTPEFDIVEKALYETKAPTPAMIEEYEREHVHDVVAFLHAYCVKMPAYAHPFIHDGLTSSDLVDYGLFRMTATHARDLAGILSHLTYIAHNLRQTREMIRPGRTHGQLADHTSWEHQLRVYLEPLKRHRVALEDLGEYLPVVKSPGPTGWPGAFSDVDARAKQIADDENIDYELGTQIVHRDRLLEWACVYLRLACALENLAQLIRAGARADVAEVREGASRTGSSSMPHKTNPIDSEKVCGLARVARGYFNAIAESVATWDDRDISNSSVERIAVPGLAATVEHMTMVMNKVMSSLVTDPQLMEAHAYDPRTMTNIYQVVTQSVLDVHPVEAAAIVREAIKHDPHMAGVWRLRIMDAIKDRGGDAEAWDRDVKVELGLRFPRQTPGPLV